MTNSMRQSYLFTKTKKEAPSDEVSKNAEFLIRGGFVHKEMAGVYSYLPLGLRVLQNKFRMELRTKSGMLRGREFIMKDMYSFHTSEDDFHNFYNTMKETYKTIFKRVGIGHLTYMTFASGGTFSKFSHEFQTITPAGEDTI